MIRSETVQNGMLEQVVMSTRPQLASRQSQSEGFHNCKEKPSMFIPFPERRGALASEPGNLTSSLKHSGSIPLQTVSLAEIVPDLDSETSILQTGEEVFSHTLLQEGGLLHPSKEVVKPTQNFLENQIPDDAVSSSHNNILNDAASHSCFNAAKLSHTLSTWVKEHDRWYEHQLEREMKAIKESVEYQLDPKRAKSLLEERRGKLNMQKDQEKQAASKLLYLLRTGGPQTSVDTSLGSFGSDESSEYTETSSFSDFELIPSLMPQELEAIYGKAFEDLLGEESPLPIACDIMSARELEKAIERQFLTMWEAVNRATAKDYLSRAIQPSPERRESLAVLRKYLSAYLQCILRVPPEAMTNEAKLFNARNGEKIGSNNLGRLMSAFLHFFSARYSPCLQQSDTTQGWVKQATVDILALIEFLHNKFIQKWDRLDDEESENIALECMQAAVFRHLPDVRAMYSLAYSTLNTALVDGLKHTLEDNNEKSLLQKLGISPVMELNIRHEALLAGKGHSLSFHELASVPSPAEKMLQMVALNIKTCETVQAHYQEHFPEAKIPVIGTDDWLPFLSWIIIKAYQEDPTSLNFLAADWLFVSAMKPPHMEHSEEGCIWTGLAAGIGPFLSFDHQKQLLESLDWTFSLSCNYPQEYNTPGKSTHMHPPLWNNNRDKIVKPEHTIAIHSLTDSKKIEETVQRLGYDQFGENMCAVC